MLIFPSLRRTSPLVFTRTHDNRTPYAGTGNQGRGQPHSPENAGSHHVCAEARDAMPVASGRHGGAAGSGAPKGKRNGKYRHGGFTTEAIDERRRLASLIRDSRDFLSRLRYSDALNEDEVRVELSSIILRQIYCRSKHQA